MYKEIKALKELLDSEAITQEEYNAKKAELLGVSVDQEKNARPSASEVRVTSMGQSGDFDATASCSQASDTLSTLEKYKREIPFFKTKPPVVAAVVLCSVVVLIAVVSFGFLSNKPSVAGLWETELFSSSGMDGLTAFHDETESYINMSADGTFAFKFDEIDLDGTWKKSEAVSEEARSIGIASEGYKVIDAYLLDGFIDQYGFLVADGSNETKLIIVTEGNPENVIVYHKASDSAA